MVALEGKAITSDLLEASSSIDEEDLNDDRKEERGFWIHKQLA